LPVTLEETLAMRMYQFGPQIGHMCPITMHWLCVFSDMWSWVLGQFWPQTSGTSPVLLCTEHVLCLYTLWNSSWLHFALAHIAFMVIWVKWKWQHAGTALQRRVSASNSWHNR